MPGQLIGDMTIKDLSPRDTNIGHRLIKNMRICGSGIYKYDSSEAALLGLSPVPEKYKSLDVINVYRPPEVLKANKDLFARIPIITGHHVLVDETNAKQLSVGMVGDAVNCEVSKEDGETYLYTTGTIIAGDGIKAYEDYGQLSVGYVPTMKWKEGIHNGEAYQAELTGFECVNHLLICKVARGGPQCMVMDSLDGNTPLERFILKHGGADMGIFNKIFGSKKVAGDEAIVSTLLQSIAVGADPATQVAKIKAIVGDSDPTFNGYLDELAKAKEEKPETVGKAVNIVDEYFKEHLAGDSEPEKKVCPNCGKNPCECKPAGDSPTPCDDSAKKEETEPGEKKEEAKPAAGDAIDYEKLASMVADKLKPAVPVNPPVNGDEAAEALQNQSPAIAGDSKGNSRSSDDLMKEIWG